MDVRGSALAGRTVAWLHRLNSRHPWSHNDHFHRWILRNLPDRRGTAVDVGCGRGELVTALAAHFRTVLGTELDPENRAVAAARCAGLPGVTVDGSQLTDLTGPIDLITMVAVLHHLDVEAALIEVKRLLAPGGRLLVVGLAPPVTRRDQLWDLASIITNPLIGLAKHPRPVTGGPQPPPFVVQDPELGFDDLRALADRILPGARLQHRLAFRHTLSWTKPQSSEPQ